MLRRLSLLSALVLLVAPLGAGGAPAQSGLSSPQLVKKGDAICAAAIRQMKAAGRITTLQSPLATMKATAARGAKWLAIDATTLKALRALVPPASDAADYRTMLASHRQSAAELAKSVKAAKEGSVTAFAEHFEKAARLAGRFGLTAWSLEFKTCDDWFL